MLDIDLTVPICILVLALAIVLAVRFWITTVERRTTQRTDALLRELGARTEAPTPSAEDGPDAEDDA